MILPKEIIRRHMANLLTSISGWLVLQSWAFTVKTPRPPNWLPDKVPVMTCDQHHDSKNSKDWAESLILYNNLFLLLFLLIHFPVLPKNQEKFSTFPRISFQYKKTQRNTIQPHDMDMMAVNFWGWQCNRGNTSLRWKGSIARKKSPAPHLTKYIHPLTFFVIINLSEQLFPLLMILKKY